MNGAVMQREYSIDLLKILAMLFIVFDHILYWGGWGFCAGRPGVKGFMLESLDAVCLCHVNCFVLSSGWIMSRMEFKMKRVVKLYLEVWGYSLAFVLLAWLCFPSINLGLKDALKNLLPISMDRYWFFTEYLILFCAMPVLNVAIKVLDRKVLSSVLWIGFLCFSIHPILFNTDIFQLNRGYSALWFMYLYLLAGTMALRGLFKNVSMMKSIIVASASLLGVIALLHLRSLLSLGIEHRFRADLFRAYNCPFILAYSVAMFLVFSKVNNIPSRVRTVIGMISPSVFAVYIIHSNKLFRVMTDWTSFWQSFLDNHSAVVCAFCAIGAALIIFFACILVDGARRLVVSKLSSCYMRTYVI